MDDSKDRLLIHHRPGAVTHITFDDEKDVAQFLSMGGPAVGGAQPVQPGGDASRNVGDSGELQNALRGTSLATQILFGSKLPR
eukprot:1707396-Amphidinium_carterae.1